MFKSLEYLRLTISLNISHFPTIHHKYCLLSICYIPFFLFDSIHPINNLSVIKGRVFLGWTSTKLGLMFLLKDTTQWCRWGLDLRPLSLESCTLPLSSLEYTLVVYIANNIDPDQTAALGAVWSRFILFVTSVNTPWSAFEYIEQT